MKLGSQEIFYLNELDSVSGASARDCIVLGNTVSYLVKTEELGKAIGKKAANIERLRRKLKKNIEILEYCEKAEDFIKKAFYNTTIKNVQIQEEEGKKTALVTTDAENKSKILGNSGKLKRIKEIAKRNYEIDEIKIR